MKQQTEMIIERLKGHLNHPTDPKTVTETGEIEDMTRQAVEYFARRYGIEIWAKGNRKIPREQAEMLDEELARSPRASLREIGRKVGVSYQTVANYDKLKNSDNNLKQ